MEYGVRFELTVFRICNPVRWAAPPPVHKLVLGCLLHILTKQGSVDCQQFILLYAVDKGDLLAERIGFEPMMQVFARIPS